MGKPFFNTMLPALALLTFAVGCGGDGNGGTKAVSRDASLDYSIQWPDRTRAMPIAANSAVVTIAYKGQTVGSWTFERPVGNALAADSHLFTGLPAGGVTISVSAYPEPHGAGVALATGIETATLKKGEVAPQAATMASTAAKLELVADTTQVEVNKTAPLTLTARDAQDRLVLLATGEGQNLAEESVEWGSDDEAVAKAYGGPQFGKFKGLAAGTTSVWARFNGIKKSVDVTVIPASVTLTSVAITSYSGPNPAHHPWQLEATATYSDGSTKDVTSEVTWRVLPSSEGQPATITPGGYITWAGFEGYSTTNIECELEGKKSSIATFYGYM